MKAQTQDFNCNACDLGITGPGTKCNVTVGSQTTYVLNNDLPATTNYTWTIYPAGDANITVNNNSVIIVQWNNPISDTWITVTDNFCGGSETMVIRKCENTPTTYQGVADPFSSTLPGAIWNSTFQYWEVNGQKIFIQGNFYVNARTIIINCDILMGSGAAIIITPGVALKIQNNTIIQTQGKMWQGIETRQNAELTIAGSQIKDALYAINIRSQTTKLNFGDNNLFERNYIALKTSDCPNKHIIISPNGIKKTVFSGDLSLVAPYSGQPANTSNYSYAGFLLSDVELLTTDHGPASDRIEFYNLNNGIVAYNTNLKIRNCHFINIVPNAFFNTINLTPTINGSGIYSFQSSYYVGITNDIGGTDLTGDIYSNIFNNCKRGVYLNRKANCHIIGNTFDLMSVAGVEIVNCDQVNSYLHINNNQFSNFKYGLKAYNIANATTQVNSNNFFDGTYATGAFTGTAMHLANNIAAVTNLTLSNNTVSNTRIGLYAANIDKANIWGNTMQFEQDYTILGTYKHYGIWLDHVSNSNISFNYIFRNNANHLDITDIDKQLKAFNFKECKTDVLNTNTMTNMGTGMRFLADNQNTQLYCNAFNRHKQGVLLQNAKLLAQGSLNNPWDNTWNNFDPSDLRAAGSAFGMNPVTWYHRDPTINTNNYAPEPHSTFSVQPFPNQNSLNSICNAFRSDSVLAEYLYAIIDSTIAYSTDAAENRFKDVWFAYCLLMGNDSLRQSDIAFQNFVTTHATTNVGELAYAEFLYAQQNYSAALVVLNNITPENLVDEYKKYTLKLASENPDGDAADLSEDQLADLTGIAYTNIWRGGDGVINARVRAGLEVDDEANELRIGWMHQNDELNNSYIIDNNFDLQQFVNAFNLKNYNSYAVYNTQGKLQWQNNYPSDFTDNLAIGIYIFNANAANGNHITIKLVSLK